MSIGISSHALILIVCLGGAAAITVWSYYRTTPKLPGSIKSLLGGLRFAALALVIFLLFDPILTRRASQEKAPVLALVVDNSASQSLTDNEELLRRLQEMRSLDHPGDVRVYGFDGSTRFLGDEYGAVDSLSFAGGRTNIAQALEYVGRERSQDNIRSIVLISDGIYNSGRNPLYAADEATLPVHTVVSGDTTSFQDVRIQEVLTNELAYAGVELPVRVRILSEGYAGETVMVEIRSGSSMIGRQSLTLSGDGTEQTVDFTMTPEQPGLIRYTASVSRLENEATHHNNDRSFQVRVVENRRSILIIAGAPDPDLGALRQSLEGDPAVEIRTFTQRNDQAFYEGDLPSSLAEVDLVVLAGFPHERTSSDLLARVDQLLDGQTPLLYIAGRRFQSEALRTIGDESLPALPTSSTSATHEAQPSLTAPGSSHPIMRGSENGAAAWNSLPPAVYPDAGWRASADATVLATVRSRGVELDDPLILIRNRTGHRTAALLAFDVWQWRTLPPSLDPAYGTFDRFIENLVQWLTSPEDERLVRVQPVQELFEGGENVVFAGEVYDERLQPVFDAEVRVDIQAADGQTFPFTMTHQGNGRYRLEAGPMPEGSYLFAAEAAAGDLVLGSDEGAFSVGAMELEFQELRADAALMRQIAARTGGATADLNELERIIQEATSAPGFTSEEVTFVQESSLRHEWLLLALAILLLASEWILRKRSGMI